MNKKFTQYFTSHGLTIEGNLAYGKLYGFEVNYVIRMLDNRAPVLMRINTYASHDQKAKMISGLRNAKIKFLTPVFDDYGIILGLNDVTVGKLISRLDEILKLTIEIIKENGGLDGSYCSLCGKELIDEQFKKYNVDGFYITLDNECAQNLNAVIEKENQAFDQSPNNYIQGIFGALLGGVIGAVSFIILFMLQFISAISAFLSVYLGSLFYQKFGGKRNMMMVLIVSVISVLSICGTLFVLYILAAMGAMMEINPSITGFQAFVEMMKDSGFAGEFYSNLALTFLFTALGCGSEIYNLSKSVKRTKKIN